MANASAIIALRQIDNMATRIAGRIRVAHDYHNSLVEDGLLAMPQYATGRYLTRIMIRLPQDAAPPQVRSLLAHRGIKPALATRCSRDSSGPCLAPPPLPTGCSNCPFIRKCGPMRLQALLRPSGKQSARRLKDLDRARAGTSKARNIIAEQE